ncbi:MAG TPA: winged helix-turn-helix domain-containing protein [Candidatus Tyrphobacter sp.]
MIVYEFGPFRLDAGRLLLYLDGAPVALGPKVIKTLLALVESPGEIVTKSALLARIWPEGFVDEANLTQNVYVLRKLLRAHGCGTAIETVARRGYRFAVALRRLEGAQLPSNPPRRSWSPLLASAGMAMAAALLVGGAWAYGRSRETRPATISTEQRLAAIGHFYLTMRTSYGVMRSVLFFSRAIAQQPRNPANYAARASAYALLADYRYGRKTPQQDRALALADARRALSIDPSCGAAYAALGLVALEASRLDRSLGDLREAIALAPNDGSAREWYALALLTQGRVDIATSQLQLAQRLDPLSIATTSWLGFAAYFDRRYDDAIAYAREGLTVSPQRNSLWIALGLAQEAKGREDSAIASFSRYGTSCRACRAEAAALLAEAYMREREPARARAELAVARAGAASVRPEDLALAVIALGDRAGRQLPPPPTRMTPEDRIMVANDPRFSRLPSAERLRLEQAV